MKAFLTAAAFVVSFLLPASNVLAAPSPQLTSITIDFEGCFMGCPQYALTLNKNNQATYEGRKFVQRLGSYTSYVDFEEFLRIVSAYDPWNLKDVDHNMMDAPSMTIVMHAGSQSRTVTVANYVALPPKVAAIVAIMNGMAAEAQWSTAGRTQFTGTYLGLGPDGVLRRLEVTSADDGTETATFSEAYPTSCAALFEPSVRNLGSLSPADVDSAKSASGALLTHGAYNDFVTLSISGRQYELFALNPDADRSMTQILKLMLAKNVLKKDCP